MRETIETVFAAMAALFIVGVVFIIVGFVEYTFFDILGLDVDGGIVEYLLAGGYTYLAYTIGNGIRQVVKCEGGR